MRRTRRPAGPTSRRRSRSSTCWSSSTRIRRVSAVLHDRTDGVYLLPAATQYETVGLGDGVQPLAAVAREGVRAVLRGQARPRDHVSVRQEVRLRQGDVQEHQGREATSRWSRTSPARSTRGMWTIGYTGQSPERLKLHMANQHTFDKVTLQGQRRPVRRRLLRPAVAVLGHRRHEASRHAQPLRHVQARCRGRPQLPRQLRADRRRARTTSGPRTILSPTACWRWTATRSAPRSRTATRQFTMGMLMKLGWDKDLTPEELATIEKIGGDKPESVAWTDRHVGRHPARGDQARHARRSATARRAAWSGTSRTACRCTASRSTRRGATWWPKYPTHTDRKLNRLPLLFESIQDRGRRQGLSRSS